MTPQVENGGDSLGEKTLHSLGWTALDRWGTRIFSLITFTILGRLLDASDFGLIALGTAFIALSNILTDSGLSTSLVQRDELTEEHINAAFFMNLGLSLGAMLVLCASSPLIARLFDTPALQNVVIVQSFAILLAAFTETPAALLERDFKFKALALRRIVGGSISGTCAVILALSGFGVWSLVAQPIIFGVISIATLWASTPWRPSFRISRESVRELWGVGSNILGLKVVTFVSMQGDQFLVGAVAGNTALGYYYFATRIITLASEMLSTVFSMVSLTVFSRLQNDRERLLSWLYRFVSGSSIVSIPIFFMAAATAPVFIPLVFGNQWEPAVRLIQILSLLGSINSIAYFDRSALLGSGHGRAALWMVIGQMCLGLTLVAIAVQFSVTWVAIAIVARQYLYWPVRLAVLRSRLGVQPMEYVKRLAIPFVSAGIAVAPIFLIDFDPSASFIESVAYLMLSVVASGLIYLALLRLLARAQLDDISNVVMSIPRLSPLFTRLHLRKAVEPA
ncbi:lipopolysaccharide biosynthesis protein [soil metagenome]